MINLIGLNKKQRAAVQHIKGPLLIIAGAGSGKTKALTHRVAYLIKEKKVPPSAILAVTFTNKAASEMRERIKILLMGGDIAGAASNELPFVGTFHSLGVKMLRRDIDKLGYQSRFAIYDTQDSLAVIKQVLQDLQLDPKQFNPRFLLSLIGRAKNELQTAASVAKRAHEFMEEITAKVYARYQNKLQAANALDFDDLLMLTVRLLQEHPKVLAKYHQRIKYINVDEYQDTNHAQYMLIKLLAGSARNVAVVGDDWQAIYGWRGANLRNILEFERDYSDTKVILLEQNYRSSQNILDAAGQVIAKNKEQKSKKLWTEKKGGELITVHRARDETDEAHYVVKHVKQAKREGLDLNEIVVLYRTNAQSRTIEEACLQANLPYQIVGGVKFYDRKEVKDVLAYLKFLANPRDSVAFERLLNTPARGLGPKTRERLLAAARTHHKGDILETLLDATNNKELDGARAAASRELGLALQKLQRRLQLHSNDTSSRPRLRRVAQLINAIIRGFNFEKYLRDGSEEGEMRYENIKELMTVAGESELLDDFLEEVALVSDIDSLNDQAKALTLMTAHAAKGLEFRRVFVVGMEEGIFPHSRSLLEPRELAEERRLCYVSMTRAKEKLILVSADQRQLFGETQYNTRSRFLDDLSDDLIEQTGNTKSMTSRGTEDEEPWSDEVVVENPYRKGDIVRHPQFGQGKITGVDADLVDVAFEKGGSRTLSVNFAPLEKVS